MADLPLAVADAAASKTLLGCVTSVVALFYDLCAQVTLTRTLTLTLTLTLSLTLTLPLTLPHQAGRGLRARHHVGLHEHRHQDAQGGRALRGEVGAAQMSALRPTPSLARSAGAPRPTHITSECMLSRARARAERADRAAAVLRHIQLPPRTRGVRGAGVHTVKWRKEDICHVYICLS